MSATSKVLFLSIQKMLQIVFLLFLLLAISFASRAYAATYYVDCNEPDDSGDGSISHPKKFIQSGLDLLNPSGGDTLVIRNGIYSNEKDHIDYNHVPSGSDYTTIKTETDWKVTVNYPFILGDDNHSTNYIIIRGIRFVSPGGSVGGSVYVGHHAKFQKCAFINSLAERYGENLGIGVKYNPITEYVLVEDCYAYGQGGRYKFKVQSAKKVIFRRVVARSDGGWGNSGGNPEAVFMTYNSEDVLWENCIAIDCDQEYEYWNGAFYMANKTGDDFPIKLKNVSWIGNIVINVRGHGFHSDINLSASNMLFENNVIVYKNNPGYGFFTYHSCLDATINRLTIIGADRGIDENYSGCALMAKNFIVANSLRENLLGNITKNYFVSWKNDAATDGSTFPNDPFSNGLLYPIRVEQGSPLKTAGENGQQIGAEIVYRVGVTGTMWGDPGYNSITNEKLWPFPNEEQIRSDMSTEPIIGKRGFCAEGQTLTKYIWESLGNPIPSEIYGDGSNSTPSAEAGQDQTLTDDDGNGSESVTLDGSGSSDPDGTIVSYVWTENGNQIAQGETANVELAVGIHDIMLEVTDNDGATDTDVVRVTVQSINGNSLAISDVSALCPSDQNVMIKWVTDQPASGKVEYGTDTNYGEVSSLDPNLSKNHCIVLTGLSPSTTYHFRVISQDSSGNTGISDDYTFTTLPDQSGGSTCIWIEAENGIINSPMQIETDSLACNGKYITIPEGTGNTTNPSAEAIYDVDIKQAGDYYIWLLMYGPSGNNDALYIGPNGSYDRVYPSQCGQYEWVQVEVEHKSGNYAHHLNAGINRIAIGHGEELARADKILITDSPNPPSSFADTTPPTAPRNFSVE